MTDAPSIFDGLDTRYPATPGFKRAGTSQAAAEAIAPKALSLRARVLEAVKAKPGTPEQIAKRLGEPVMNVRPRLSEAAKLGLVKDSGLRGRAMGGRQAIVWCAA